MISDDTLFFFVTVSNSVKTYNISMILRNDRIKSLQVDLQLEKRYSLIAAVGKQFSDVSLDLEWDSENNPENRLVLKGKRLANEIELSLNYLSNKGKFIAKHDQNKVHIDVEYNGEKAKFVGEYVHDPIRNLYGLKGKMETTIPKLEKAAFEIEHLFEKVGDKTILSQKVIFFSSNFFDSAARRKLFVLLHDLLHRTDRGGDHILRLAFCHALRGSVLLILILIHGLGVEFTTGY